MKKDIVWRFIIFFPFQTLKYEEEYSLALESFNQAILLDPTWDTPKIKEQELVKYLDNVTELISTTGKMRGKKRLHQILNVRIHNSYFKNS